MAKNKEQTSMVQAIVGPNYKITWVSKEAIGESTEERPPIID